MTVPTLMDRSVGIIASKKAESALPNTHATAYIAKLSMGGAVCATAVAVGTATAGAVVVWTTEGGSGGGRAGVVGEAEITARLDGVLIGGSGRAGAVPFSA